MFPRLEPGRKRTLILLGSIIYLVTSGYLPVYTVNGVGYTLLQLTPYSTADTIAMFAPCAFMFIAMVSGTKEKWAQLVLKVLGWIFSVGGLASLLWSMFKNVFTNPGIASLSYGFFGLAIGTVLIAIGVYWPGTRPYGDPERYED